MGTLLGTTSVPARTRNRPLTTTFSPAFSPSVTTRVPSGSPAPTVTLRYSALLSLPITRR